MQVLAESQAIPVSPDEPAAPFSVTVSGSDQSPQILEERWDKLVALLIDIGGAQ